MERTIFNKSAMVCLTNKFSRKMELELLNYVIKERGAICEMPKLNPFSEEGMRFRRNVTKVTCPGVDWVKCYVSKEIYFLISSQAAGSHGRIRRIDNPIVSENCCLTV